MGLLFGRPSPTLGVGIKRTGRRKKHNRKPDAVVKHIVADGVSRKCPKQRPLEGSLLIADVPNSPYTWQKIKKISKDKNTTLKKTAEQNLFIIVVTIQKAKNCS